MSNSRARSGKGKILPTSIITRLEFSNRHYLKAQFPTDMFYVKVANRLLPLITRALQGLPGATPSTPREVTLNLVCYVEDLVSGTGVWQAFLNINTRRYGTPIPFYSTDYEEYDPELPSFEAVSFLIWYTLNSTRAGSFLNPTNPALMELAGWVFPILEEAYDEAPDTLGRPMLQPSEQVKVPLYYQIRNICAWLLDTCYLTRLVNPDKATGDLTRFLMHINDDLHVSPDMLEYAINAFIPFNTLVGPMGAYPQEWLLEMMEYNHNPAEEQFMPVVRDLKSLPFNMYRYEKVTEKGAILIDVDGQRLDFSAYTMPEEKMPGNIKTGDSAFMSLVYFDGSWVINSIALQSLPPEAYEDARANRKKDQANYKATIDQLGGVRIGVCRDFKEYLSHFPGIEKQKETSEERQMRRDLNNASNLLYFLNTDGKVSLVPDTGNCIDIPGNRFYDPTNRRGINLILNHDLSTPEMRQYIIEHNLIPGAGLMSMTSPEAGIELFQQNIRFLNDYAGRDTVIYIP